MYCFKKIDEISNNESAWVYLKGLFDFKPEESKLTEKKFVHYKSISIKDFIGVILIKKLKKFCESHASDPELNRFALAILIDINLFIPNSENLSEAYKVLFN